jgi:hypothetical protein
MPQRNHEAAERQSPATSQDVHQATQPARNALLRLQSSVGNRAVTHAITVQRQKTYLDTLPSELVTMLGSFVNRSEGSVSHLRAAAAPRGGAVDRGVEAEKKVFPDAYNAALALQGQLDALREAVRREELKPGPVLNEKIAKWARTRQSLANFFRSNAPTLDPRASFYRQAGSEVVGQLPADFFAARAYILELEDA